MTLQDWLAIGNLVVVVATGVIVWLYTKAAQRSNEIQEQPLLSMFFDEIPNHGGARLGNIRIKNIGKRPAYNVVFEPFELQGFQYRFYLETPTLESEEEVQPRAVVRTPEGGTEAFEQNLMWFLHRLIPRALNAEAVEYARNNPALFLLRYKGVNGKSYYSLFAMFCTIPPVGEIFMQFVAHGSGNVSMAAAKRLWDKTEKMRSPFEH